MSGVDGAWLAAQRARANQPPLRPRVPLLLGTAVVGSVEPVFAQQMRLQPALDVRTQLSKQEQSVQAGDLRALALAMRAQGLTGVWRNEQLAVHALQGDEPGERVATVERGAVRPLGVVTQAVHLVGRSPGGGMWVQQRAFDKANDPGLWDTLMGGMVSAADTLAQALARETMEEAGLALSDLQGLRHGGRVTLRRPSEDGLGMGYMVEHIDWFEATVPGPMVPVNQDGEVQGFECLGLPDLLERLHAGAFTLEASLILAAALGA